MSIPWILLQWRALERDRAEAARSRVHAAGLPHVKDTTAWGKALERLDGAIRRLSRKRRLFSFRRKAAS